MLSKTIWTDKKLAGFWHISCTSTIKQNLKGVPLKRIVAMYLNLSFLLKIQNLTNKETGK